MNLRLTKITLLTAFPPDAAVLPETMGEAAAEMLRDLGAITAASEYESVVTDVPEDDDNDELVDALVQQFPNDGLTVGMIPGVKVLGRNGTFKHAQLKRNGDRIELWLGTEKEQFPLVSFPAAGDGIGHYPVPAGKERREGVEYGCGNGNCKDCYVVIKK
jgi:hypothetical protein